MIYFLTFLPMRMLKLFLVPIIFCIGITSVFADVPTNGLVGEWLLNGNANDTSGNGHNGTAYNVTYDNTGAYFNGSAYIDAGTHLDITG